jgi:hypothetical protein
METSQLTEIFNIHALLFLDDQILSAESECLQYSVYNMNKEAAKFPTKMHTGEIKICLLEEISLSVKVSKYF